MKKFILIIFCLSAILHPTTARAQVSLTISKKFGERIAVSVAPFSGNTYQSKQISSLIQNNLSFSGFFKPVANPSFVIDQHNEDLKSGFIDFKGWQSIATEILVKGKIIASGNELNVEFEVFSPSDHKRIFGKGLKGKKDELKYIAHVIADEILQKLTGNPPVFSKQIAFTTDHFKIKTIIVSDLSGQKQTRLFNEKEMALTPCWFHKSNKLAYVSYRKKNPNIYVMDMRTGANEAVAHFPGLNANPDLSVDDRFLAFTASRDGNPEIYVKDLVSKRFLRVTHHRAVDGDPTVSPDGKSVAFVSNRFGTPQLFLQKGKSQPKRITYDGRYNSSPIWSPKGDLIAYASN